MDNPFLKRATELFRDDEAFLAVVSPEPLEYFLAPSGRQGLLFERLVIVRGTPGSGKTTLARMFEYPTLAALLRNSSQAAYQKLLAVLNDCRAIIDTQPVILGHRLAMETDYRVFWEFPYPEESKLALMIRLIQARAVLGWFRHLEKAGISLQDVKIIPRPEAEATIASIGGINGADVQAKAREAETALYKIIGALIAPPISQLDSVFSEPYHPFDVIERIEVANAESGKPSLALQPLVILDDAHALHPQQFKRVQQWLARRELRVGRWMLTRLDVLHPSEALRLTVDVDARAENRAELPGITSTRDTTEIMLQPGGSDRGPQRTAFRKMARDMAARYLGQMPLFRGRGLVSLPEMLNTELEAPSPAKLRELEVTAQATRNKLRTPTTKAEAIEKEVSAFLKERNRNEPDVHIAMTLILLHRYAKRTEGQRSLFGEEETVEHSKPLTVNSAVYEGACIHLLHRNDRPFYFGMDDICDASTENAEQFLRLAACLVEAMAAQLIRGKRSALDASAQHRLLRQRATEVIDSWSFPECQAIRRLVDAIARRCLEHTLLPNAWLGSGANAYGILQESILQLPEQHPRLARVLQFGLAYNAFRLVPHYQCKGREWCIIELGGMAILNHGLTLKRGGFVEGRPEDLIRVLEGGEL